MEVVNFSLIGLEDLDIGNGTRQVRLGDGALHTLHQIQLSSLLIPKTVRLSALSGDAVMSAPIIQAGMRVAGVTSQIIDAFGTSLGLTGLNIGDSITDDRWGTQATLTANAETDQGDFGDAEWPIYASGDNVLIHAVGGLFDGTGRLEITLWAFYLTHRSA